MITVHYRDMTLGDLRVGDVIVGVVRRWTVSEVHNDRTPADEVWVSADRIGHFAAERSRIDIRGKRTDAARIACPPLFSDGWFEQRLGDVDKEGY